MLTLTATTVGGTRGERRNTAMAKFAPISTARLTQEVFRQITAIDVPDNRLYA